MYNYQYQPHQDLKETGEHDDASQTGGGLCDYKTSYIQSQDGKEGKDFETSPRGHTKSRKGQVYKIKKLSHKSKPLNPYIIFYKDFYKNILEKDFPDISQQEKIAKTGEAWRNLPNDLKNGFYQYANNKNFLMTQSSDSPLIPFVSNSNLKEDTLKIIYDPHCFNNIAQ